MGHVVNQYGGDDCGKVRSERAVTMAVPAGASGPQLSDHDGIPVTYELSWPAGMTAKSVCRGD